MKLSGLQYISHMDDFLERAEGAIMALEASPRVPLDHQPHTAPLWSEDSTKETGKKQESCRFTLWAVPYECSASACIERWTLAVSPSPLSIDVTLIVEPPPHGIPSACLMQVHD